MAKKRLFYSMVLLLILLFIAPFSIKAATNVLQVSNTSFGVVRGQEFKTTLFIEEGSNATGLTLTLNYDLKIVKLIDYEIIEASEVNINNNVIIIVYAGTENISEKLDLVELTFIVEEEIGIGQFDDWLYWAKGSEDDAFTTDGFEGGTPNYSDLEIQTNFSSIHIREKGDAYDNKGDGKINARDASYILQHASHMFTMNLVDQYYANVYEDYDANNNPKISARDASLILQYSAHMDVTIDKRCDIIFYVLNDINEYDVYIKKSVKKDNALINIPTIEKEGYEIKWSLSSKEYVEVDFSNITTDLKVYAYYEEKHMHTEVVDVAKEATCLETGLTEGSHCGVCNEVLVEQTIIEALGHDIQEHEGKEATCTEIGYEAYETCSRCSYTTYVEIGAKGHTYSNEWSYDETYHWNSATCGHTNEVKNKSQHILDSNYSCNTCKYSAKIQLEQPSDIYIEYDTIYWTGPENADTYTVRVNNNYTCPYELRGNSLPLADVQTSTGIPIMDISRGIKVEIWANEYGQYSKSSVTTYNSEYVYVPEYTDTISNPVLMTNLKIGCGYDLIQNQYLEPTYVKDVSVFNINKLLSLGDFAEVNATTGVAQSYTYSTIDEYFSNIEVKEKFSADLKYAPVGNLKAQLELYGNQNYKKYTYNEMYIYAADVLYRAYGFLNVNQEDYKYCLNDSFIKDVLKESEGTIGLTTEEHLKFLYEKYGTHSIVGVKTGGTYVATYSISTNSEEFAEKVRINFKMAASSNDSLSEVFKVDLGVELDTNGSWTSIAKDSVASLKLYYTGSTAGAYSTGNALDQAIGNWSSGMNAGTAAAYAFTDGGSISIASLIEYIKPGLGKAYEQYLDSKANDAYYELCEKYTKDIENPVKSFTTESVNNELLNVLTINLSGYQSLGSLEDLEDSNYLKGLYTVYPSMFGKDIDKIVVVGNFGKNAENRKLMDKFSIKLSEHWNRDVQIVFRNCGFICGSEDGIVDDSEVGKNVKVNIEYEGINVIQEVGGDVYCYSTIGDKQYQFKLEYDEDATLDFSTANIDGSTLVLPIQEKDYYTFLGWTTEENDESDTEVIVDSLGNVNADYEPLSDIVSLYPKFGPDVYKIVLDNENANETGTKEFYVHYGEGFFADYEGQNAITNIQIPKKTGMVFKGYYISDNKVIDENGTLVVSNTAFEKTPEEEKEFTLTAKWEPKVSQLILSNDAENEDATDVLYIKYNTGIYVDPNCTVEFNEIIKPEKTEYAFTGYINANGDIIIEADGIITDTISQQLIKNVEDITISVLWTELYTITLDHKGGTSTVSKYYTKDGDGCFLTLDDAKNGVNAITTIDKPSRAGYGFAGYKTLNGEEVITSNGEIIFSEFTNNTTIYAQWELVEYTITLMVDGNEFGTINFTYYDELGNVNTYGTLSKPEKTGYDFDGWRLSDQTDDVISSNDQIAYMTDHYLYAKFSAEERSVSVSSNDSTLGAVSIDPNNSIYHYDEMIKLVATPTSLGEFEKWIINDREYYTATVTITIQEDITANATFKQNKYTVTFNTNGGSSISTLQIPYGSAMIFGNYIPTKEGHTFGGWYSDQTFTSKYSDTYANAENKDLVAYAKWTPKQYKCTVTFTGDYNTNCSTIMFITYTNGTKETKTLKPYVIDGYYDSFLGYIPPSTGASFSYTLSYGDVVEIMASQYTCTETVSYPMIGDVTMKCIYKCEYQQVVINGETTINVVFTRTAGSSEYPWLQ